VFAIGDVRSGSVKRVAAAVGESAQVVAAIHAYLANSGATPRLYRSAGLDRRGMRKCGNNPPASLRGGAPLPNEISFQHDALAP